MKSFFQMGLGLSLALVAISSSAQQKPAEVKSTSADRKKVGITVYNQGIGLVREVRALDVGAGTASLEFADVASQIMPSTVHIRATGDASALRVLEQNYRYDLLGPETLLEKYVGKKIKVYRWNEKRGTDESFDADVLSVQSGRPVLRIGNEITFDFPGRLAFPSVPPNLIAKPTLVWLVDSKKPKQEAEVTYLTRGLSWNADYVLTVDEKDTLGDLTGWVTLTNQSGAGYENAELKLVAGDVNIAPEATESSRDGFYRKAPESRDAEDFQEEGFFEYHLYTLERPTTVRDNEQKQVTLLEGRGAKIQKKLVFRGMEYIYLNPLGEPISNQKVSVYLEIQNAKENALGMPLPRGVVRVYKADKSGAKQFIGEDRIDHTPRDEKIRIKTGDAFDIVGERKQTDFDALGTCQSESAWEIELRNHKDEAVEVEVREPVSGDWEMISESQKHKKEDARTFSYAVKIPARGKTKVTYRVRVRWC
jgi:hypothetical protein